MKNDAIVNSLQTALSMELAAVLQYQLHAHVAEDWGLDRLASKMREEMAEEQGHADSYIRRIMFLGGDPVLKAAKTPKRAQTIVDMFKADLADELDAIKFYGSAAQTANGAGDVGTRNLFETTLLDEEGHKAWLETQLALVERLGEPTYWAMQISESNGPAES